MAWTWRRGYDLGPIPCPPWTRALRTRVDASSTFYELPCRGATCGPPAANQNLPGPILRRAVPGNERPLPTRSRPLRTPRAAAQADALELRPRVPPPSSPSLGHLAACALGHAASPGTPAHTAEPGRLRSGREPPAERELPRTPMPAGRAQHAHLARVPPTHPLPFRSVYQHPSNFTFLSVAGQCGSGADLPDRQRSHEHAPVRTMELSDMRGDSAPCAFATHVAVRAWRAPLPTAASCTSPPSHLAVRRSRSPPVSFSALRVTPRAVVATRPHRIPDVPGVPDFAPSSPPHKRSQSRRTDEADAAEASAAVADKSSTSTTTSSASTLAAPKTLSPRSAPARLRRTKRRTLDHPSEVDAFAVFAREIRRYSLLSADEERSLAQSIQLVRSLNEAREALSQTLEREPTLSEWAHAVEMENEQLSEKLAAGAAAKETLVNANLRLVVHLARKTLRERTQKVSTGGDGAKISSAAMPKTSALARGRAELGACGGVPLLDLIQEGALSLIRAAELYDPERGFRFASYAWPVVLAGVRRAARTPPGSVVAVPERLVLAANKMRAFRARKMLETGSWPTRQQEEQQLPPKVSMSSLRSAEPHLRSALLLDRPVQEADELTVMDVLASDVEAPEEFVDRDMMQTKVCEAVNKHLSPRTAEIVAAKFGLNGSQPELQRTIASRHGISSARVTQLVADGLAKIRKLEPGLVEFLKSDP